MDKRAICRPVNVTLCRDGLAAPWGFRLHGGQDFDNPLLVQKVTSSGAADGFLKRGDLIIKIDGFDAANLTHNAALNLIANAGSSINLSLLRPSFGRKNMHHDKTAETTSNPKQPDQVLVDSIIPESADNRVRFVDNFSTNEKDEKVGSNINPFDYDDDQERRFLVTEQAKKLAGIMKASLRNSSKEPKSSTFRKTSDPSTKTHVDITSFLPHAPPKRCYPASSSSLAAAATTSPPPEIRAHLKDSLLLRTGSSAGAAAASSSGRSTPASGSSIIELGSPTDRRRPLGVWVPPAQHPSSKLVHLQYNSPLGLYSAHNVADSVEKMTGSKVEWLNQPPSAKYLDDIRQSATYKFVQELEGRRPSPNAGKTFEQSTTLKNMSRYFGVDSS